MLWAGHRDAGPVQPGAALTSSRTSPEFGDLVDSGPPITWSTSPDRKNHLVVDATTIISSTHRTHIETFRSIDRPLPLGPPGIGLYANGRQIGLLCACAPALDRSSSTLMSPRVATSSSLSRFAGAVGRAVDVILQSRLIDRVLQAVGDRYRAGASSTSPSAELGSPYRGFFASLSIDGGLLSSSVSRTEKPARVACSMLGFAGAHHSDGLRPRRRPGLPVRRSATTGSDNPQSPSPRTSSAYCSHDTQAGRLVAGSQTQPRAVAVAPLARLELVRTALMIAMPRPPSSRSSSFARSP